MTETERKAQHWDVIAGVVREVDRAHRGGDGPGMHDDDLVDVAAKALRDFPGLVKDLNRARTESSAESGHHAPTGWVWADGEGAWLIRTKTATARVYGRYQRRYEIAIERGRVVSVTVHPCESALDGFARVAVALAGS